MYPYFAMLAVPGGLALTGWRPGKLSWFLVGLAFVLLIGFRFQVGMDWNNYIDLHRQKQGWSLFKFVTSREPGFGLLTWISLELGWSIIFVDVISALVFCWGFFSVARRCSEPWIAVTIATPLLVIAFAMSGIRQALAMGIIYHSVARWDDQRTPTRAFFVMLAGAFHFSAIFMMIFVALGSKASNVIRIGGAILIGLLIVAVVYVSPESMEAYSRLYVASGGALTAPGAIFEVAPLAAAAVIYLAVREPWTRANSDHSLNAPMAWASLLAIPAILVSSVGTYRFALYLWPMAMSVYAGSARTIENGIGRLFYRICIVASAFALLLGWLLLANNSYAWIPYKNWLAEPDNVILWRSHYRSSL